MLRNAWINPEHFKRCDGKQAYRTMKQAEIRAERASKSTGELIIAYTCFDCRMIHIGHADLSQQLARIPHVDRACQHCAAEIPESKKQKAERFRSVALYCSDQCQAKASADRRTARRNAASVETNPS